MRPHHHFHHHPHHFRAGRFGGFRPRPFMMAPFMMGRPFRPYRRHPMAWLGWIIVPLILFFAFGFFLKTWWLWLLLALPFLIGGGNYARRWQWHDEENPDSSDSEKRKNGEKPKRDVMNGYDGQSYEIIDDDDNPVYRV